MKACMCLEGGGYSQQPLCHLRMGRWIELLSKPPHHQHLCERRFPASVPRKSMYLFTSEIWSHKTQPPGAVLCPQLRLSFHHGTDAQRSFSPQQPWQWWRQACWDWKARGTEFLPEWEEKSFSPQLGTNPEVMRSTSTELYLCIMKSLPAFSTFTEQTQQDPR